MAKSGLNIAFWWLAKTGDIDLPGRASKVAGVENGFATSRRIGSNGFPALLPLLELRKSRRGDIVPEDKVKFKRAVDYLIFLPGKIHVVESADFPLFWAEPVRRYCFVKMDFVAAGVHVECDQSF